MAKARYERRNLLQESLRASTAPRKTKRTALGIDPDLAERLRDAAHWERLTMKAALDAAVLEYLDRLEEKRGESFPPRPKR